MSIGTIFTLFVTPAIYTLIARDHNRIKQQRQPGSEVPPIHQAQERSAAE
jgi:multidrug efflux pump